jgi:hypothetical protein
MLSGKAIKDAVTTQMADVFDTLEQLRVKNKQLTTQLAIEKADKQQYYSRLPPLSHSSTFTLFPVASRYLTLFFARPRTENTLPLNLDNILIQEKLAATGML